VCRFRVLPFLPFTKFSFRFRRRKFIKTATAAALSFRDTRAGARLISFLLHPTPVAGTAVACDPPVVIIQYVYTRGERKKKYENNCKKTQYYHTRWWHGARTRCRQRFFSIFFFFFFFNFFVFPFFLQLFIFHIVLNAGACARTRV
jgi:hypothetical protein